MMTIQHNSSFNPASLMYQINGDYQAATADLCIILDRHGESCQDSSIFNWGEKAVKEFVFRAAWKNKPGDEIDHAKCVSILIQELVQNIFLNPLQGPFEQIDLEGSLLSQNNLKVLKSSEHPLVKDLLKWLKKWTIQIRPASSEHSFPLTSTLDYGRMPMMLQGRPAEENLENVDLFMQEMEDHFLQSMQEAMHEAELVERQFNQKMQVAHQMHLYQIVELQNQCEAQKQSQQKEIEALVMHLAAGDREHRLQTDLAKEIIESEQAAAQVLIAADIKQKQNCGENQKIALGILGEELDQARTLQMAEEKRLKGERNLLDKNEKTLKKTQDQLAVNARLLNETLTLNAAQKVQIANLSRK